MTHDFVADLDARGLLQQTTSPDLGAQLAAEPVTAYVGFDPSADSLHVGSLLPVLALVRLQRAGHRPIALVGGATGRIGDPSGKDAERTLLDEDALARNTAGLRSQLEQFLEFGPSAATMVDNADWLGKLGYIEFLRDYGKSFSVNQMIVRDSVRTRLERPDQGISYTEFSYMLLQAYDFLELNRRHGCTLQVGGSDQWGNIVSGADLIRRYENQTAHGLTWPLVTRPDGRKFGKSEQGNIWLSPERTSPFEFYQFWLNVEDDEVAKYLHYFTLLPVAELVACIEEARAHPERRIAQKLLAREVTAWVHGAGALQRAEKATEVLFGKSGGDWHSLDAESLEQAFRHSPRSTLPRSTFGAADAGLVAVVANSGLSPSRSQARQAVQSGAIYVNDVRRSELDAVLTERDAIGGRFIVLRRGKKSYHVLEVVDG